MRSIIIALALIARFIGPNIDFREWKSLLKFLAASCVAAIVAGGFGGLLIASTRSIDVLGSWMTWSLATGFPR